MLVFLFVSFLSFFLSVSLSLSLSLSSTHIHCNCTMLIKSAVALTAAAVTAAQGSNSYIMFTNPVGSGVSFMGGDNVTFSWINPCAAPYTKVSAAPTHTEVQLIDATNPTMAFFLQTVGYIDCNVAAQGSSNWVVPPSLADPSKSFSLMIAVSPPTYSGTFQILGSSSTSSPLRTSLPPSASTTPPPTSTAPTTTLVSATSTTLFPWTQPTNIVPGENNTSDGSNGSLSTGAVVGIVLGVLVVLIAIVYIIWRRRANKPSSPGEEEARLDVDEPKLEGELKGDPTIPHGAPMLMEEKRGNLTLGSQPQYILQRSFSTDQSTAEEQQRKQQKEEEIRRQIQLLQFQLEQSQGEQHYPLEESSAPSMTFESYTLAPFKPPVDGSSHGSHAQLRENLQLSNHPKPNVATTIQ